MDRDELREKRERLLGFENSSSTSSNISDNISDSYQQTKFKRIKKFLKETNHQPIIFTTIIVQEQTIEYRNIFIDTLHDERYILKKAIPVGIEHAEQVYIATNYDLGLYGYGDTEGEAVDDLRKSIIECYEDLKEEKELALIPSKMMAYYKEIIEER